MAISDNGRMNIGIGLDNSKLRTDAIESQYILRSITQSSEVEGSKIDAAFRRVGATIAGVFGAQQALNFARNIIDVRKEIESFEISFRTLLGDEAKAKQLFNEIKEFAVRTPLQLKDLAGAAQTLLGFNIDESEIMPMLKAIGDVSMGDAQKLQSLTLAFAQMSSTGKLMGQDLLQMINAGFNPLAIISEKTGKSIGELKEEMSKGAISADMVKQAFIDATSEGGKFHGMLEEQSKGIGGALSNLQGAFDDMLNELGSSSQGVITGTINWLTDLVKNYERVGRIIGSLIITYGTYRASVMAATVAERCATVAQGAHLIKTNLLQKAHALLNKTMLNNPFVLAATAVASLTVAVANLKTKEELLREESEKYDKHKQELLDKEAEHNTKIQTLITAIEDDSSATGDRREAMLQLMAEYPELFKKYETEYEALKNIAEIKREIAGIEAKKSIDNPANELAEVEKQLDEAKKNYHFEKEYYRDTNGQSRARDVVKYDKETQAKIDLLTKKRDELKKKVKKVKVDEYFSDLSKLDDDAINEMIAKRTKLINDIDTKYYESPSGAKTKYTYGEIKDEGGALDGRYNKNELQQQVNALTMEKNKRLAPRNSADDWTKKVKSEYEEALKNYNDFIADTTTQYTEEEFETKKDELQKKLKSAKDKLDSTKKSENANKSPKDNEKSKENRIKVQIAERSQQIEDKTKAIAKAERDSELEIAEAEINAMEEGMEKTLRYNELTYKKMCAVNEDRKAAMLEQLRDIAELQWKNDNPAANDNGLVFDRNSIPEDLLNLNIEVDYDSLDKNISEAVKTMRAQLSEYSRIAEENFVLANKKSLDEALSDVLSYEQQREKIEKDYARRMESLYEHDENGNRAGLRQGVNQDNVDELQYQSQEAIRLVDEQFATRSEDYKAWCDSVANMTLKQLEDLLSKAQEELERMKEDGDINSQTLAAQRSKVVTLLRKVKTAKAAKDCPDKRSIKEWEDLYKTLQECEREFETIGDAVGGVAGEIMKVAGQISTSVLQMINGIVTLANSSATAMAGTAAAASTAIRAVERASVILTVISAALQIATAIANLFNNDDKKQKEIERLQDRIDQLQWELDNADIMRLNANYETSLRRVNKAIYATRQEIIESGKAAGDWAKVMFGCYIQLSKDATALTKTTTALASEYEKMSYTASKALGEGRYTDYFEQLQNISEQQVLIQEQIIKEKSKKDSDTDEISDMEKKLEELGLQAANVINDLVEEIIGGSAEQISDDLSAAFFDAFANGEDAAEAWGDKVKEIASDIVKRMLVQKLLEPEIGKIFDKYKAQWFKDGKFAGADAIKDSMSSFMSDLTDLNEVMTEIWESIPDDLRTFLTGDSERDGVSKGIAAASQDSVDELNARATTIQSHTFSISENTKLLVANTASILTSVLAIERHTEAISTRMEVVERDLHQVRNTIDEFSTQGVKLK